jgi:hypothetical protein
MQGHTLWRQLKGFRVSPAGGLRPLEPHFSRLGMSLYKRGGYFFLHMSFTVRHRPAASEFDRDCV